MSKIDRYNGDLKAFGADSVSTERTVFGKVTQSNTLDDNLNADFFRGWGIIGVNDFPPIGWFNAFGFTATQLLAYLHQMGVAEWNTNQEYYNGSVCIDGAGKVYISKTASNTGNALPANEDANWKRVLDFSDLNNTALTGVPTAPTAAVSTNTTQLATTEFVSSEIPSKLNASGAAPIFACRAWVNFNGTGTVAIRASGNVSSITDNGTGSYNINFTTAMEDEAYATIVTTENNTGANNAVTGGIFLASTYSVNAVTISTHLSSTGQIDRTKTCVAIFR